MLINPDGFQLIDGLIADAGRRQNLLVLVLVLLVLMLPVLVLMLVVLVLPVLVLVLPVLLVLVLVLMLGVRLIFPGRAGQVRGGGQRGAKHHCGNEKGDGVGPAAIADAVVAAVVDVPEEVHGSARHRRRTPEAEFAVSVAPVQTAAVAVAQKGRVIHRCGRAHYAGGAIQLTVAA